MIKENKTSLQKSTANAASKHLKAMATVIRQLSERYSKQEFFDHIVSRIQQESGCRFVGIRILDDNGYIPYQSYVGFSREFWEAENMIQISKEDCSCTRIVSGALRPCDLGAINQAGSLCINDSAAFGETLSEDDLAMFRGACVKAGFLSIAIIPVTYRGRTVGLIHLADPKSNQLNETVMNFVELIAPLVGEVIGTDKIEKTLEYSRNNLTLLRGIVSGIRNLAYVVDVDTYKLVYSSRSIDELCGEDMLGHTCYELFGDSEPCHDCPATVLSPAGERITTWERYDNRHNRHYLAELKTITWPEGFQFNTIAFVMDISEQRQAEKLLQERNQRLRQNVMELQQLSATLEEEIMERELAQQTLERYRLFFTHSRDIMLFVERNTGKIIEVNPAAEAAYGYTRGELLEKNIFDLRIEKEMVLAENQLAVAAQSGICFETVHRRRDGSLFPVEVNSVGEYIGGKPILFSVVRDITDRKAVQNELWKLNAQLEEKIADRTRELQDINAALEEEVMERQVAQEELYRLNSSLESKVEQRTRELQNINASLEKEVLERQTMQEALEENRERYVALVKQASDAIAVIDFDTARITEINDSLLRMFGYMKESLQSATIDGLGLVTLQELIAMKNALLKSGKWEGAIRRYQQGWNQSIFAERTASLIRHRGNCLILLMLRDVTEQKKLQAEIHNQVKLAGAVQKSLLPADSYNDHVDIRTLFQPLNLVSGDFFGYRWSHDTTMLHGYIIDVTGHGMATALHASAVSTLLNEAMENEQPWNKEMLFRLNHYLNGHFQDNVFAALLVFTFDFKNAQLTCSSCGINYLLASTKEYAGKITVPGMYLGVSDVLEFETISMPIQNGDTVYFITDGISEDLSPDVIDNVYRFEDTVMALRQLTQGAIHDDCSALCFKVKGAKQFPLFFAYSAAREQNCIRQRIHAELYKIVQERFAKIEVAFGEAFVNATRHCKSLVRVKINKIGQTLIVRVKDDGSGFMGNQRVKELIAKGTEQIFEELLCAEGGRGIPIMTVWTDRVLYNRKGNEVMLVKKLVEDVKVIS